MKKTISALMITSMLFTSNLCTEAYEVTSNFGEFKICDVISSYEEPAIKQWGRPAKVYVNGKEMTFDAYNVGGNNYFKLRDIAKALKGSSKEFNVVWDDEKASIALTKNTPYEEVGDELISGSTSVSEATPNLASTYLDGEDMDLFHIQYMTTIILC